MRTLNELSGTWTWVRDNGGGGVAKTGDFFFQGTEDEAMDYMDDVLDYDPHGVTCECCGSDFSFDDGGLVKMAILEVMTRNQTCEWHHNSGRLVARGYSLITYAMAQQMVLDSVNNKGGKPSVRFIFRDEMDKGLT